MIETIHTEAGDTIRTMTPVEYQKLHAADDIRHKRENDLTAFLAWMQSTAGMLRELPADKATQMVTDYLDATTPEARP